jgi:hypothetical protein
VITQAPVSKPLDCKTLRSDQATVSMLHLHKNLQSVKY